MPNDTKVSNTAKPAVINTQTDVSKNVRKINALKEKILIKKILLLTAVSAKTVSIGSNS